MSIKITKKVHGKKLDMKVIMSCVQDAMSRGIHQSGKELVAFIQDGMFNGLKTGAFYPVTRGLRKGQIIQASSPNGKEMPAVRSGDLVNTVGYKANGTRSLIVGAGNNTVDYADELENSRKYLRQTAKANEKKVETNIVNQINDELQNKGLKVRKK